MNADKQKINAYERTMQNGALSFAGKAHSFAKLPVETDAADEENEPKYRRVAKFLILIGAEQAAKVLSNLEEEQVEKISAEIAGIKGINREEAATIFAEFQGVLAQNYGANATGGMEEARKLLYTAFGKEKGDEFLRRAVPQYHETSFSFLEGFTGEQISMLLRDETPATGAMILSRIDPKISAAALRSSEAEWRLETVRRIGHLGQISPEVLEKVAAALREKARNVSSAVTKDLDGMGALAAILKNTDVSFGDKILMDLSEQDPDLSKNLKERLYTLDDVCSAEDKPIQKKLHSMNSRDIAVLIKGRGDNFTEKILANISSGRRAEVRDELSFMGAIPKRDADAAVKKFMDWFRSERETGHILMIGDDLVE
ncbi:flagellar motor switch protein FliG [Spirochaetia bacterium]|nr:flagellar motor switch protein FliG [Spirochaetia bacterium]